MNSLIDARRRGLHLVAAGATPKPTTPEHEANKPETLSLARPRPARSLRASCSTKPSRMSSKPRCCRACPTLTTSPT